LRPGVVHPIIFVHVPRSGGITLASIIARQYGRRRVFFVYAEPQGDTGSALQELDGMSAEARGQIRALHGHHRFGIHQPYFSAASYVTLFRDPVERLVSYYHYIIENSRHYLHRRVVGERMSLREFVTSRASIELDNHQVRQISGQTSVAVGECSRALLDRARENLEAHFAVIGLTERFDESMVLMKRTFDWSFLVYDRLNVARDRTARQSVPPEMAAVIRDVNRWDVELYELARRRVEAAIAAQGAAFDSELRWLRRANSLYRPVRRAATRVARGLGARPEV
jgi:Sulfotransferase family